MAGSELGGTLCSLGTGCHIGPSLNHVSPQPKPLIDPIAPLLAPLTRLPGMTDALARLIARATGGDRVLNLLFHMPETYVDRRHTPTIAAAEPGTVATLKVEVISITSPERGSNQPWRVVVGDGTAFAEIAYFRIPPPAAVKPARRLLVSGRIEVFGDTKQIRAPRLVALERSADLPPIEPVWPLTKGLTQQALEIAMRRGLETIPDLPEWHDPALLRRENWPGFRDALVAVQSPKTPPGSAPRARLAYDELLAHQIAIAWTKTRSRQRPGRAITGDNGLRAQALARFGHQPTASQVKALREIDADLAAPRRMLRLLQGDVGSGKTLVAIMAMLSAAEAGHQAALMAPTEVLAKQHHRTLSRLSPIPVGLLTGSIKGIERRRVLTGLESGRLQMVVGTHALFQDAVGYQSLALAVIDEQHRFGVEQRMTLGNKGERTDVLVMTATPIPRTLLLTQWGEMEVSRLLEKPDGRQPVRTTIHSLSTLDTIIDAIARALSRHDRVYWVCPMVSESELTDLAAAEARFIVLAERFGDTVTLAHGQQDPGIRDRALAEFAAGDKRLLVATTVIEVGVDVPEASVMVIEHAERFGLAQLHQLRGRVGRGAAQSFCLLLHDDVITEAMRKRLILLRDTEDGFVIADEDFRQRGGGDLLGKRQSGLPGYRLFDPEQHEMLLSVAAKDAAVVLHREPRLDGARGQALKALLAMFGRREGVQMLDAG